MPASTVSESVSWGLYIGAAAGTLALLLPMLNTVYTQSNASAGYAEVHALTKVLDGMKQGMSVRLTLWSPTGGTLVMSGNTLTLVTPAGSWSEHCRWHLPNVSLEEREPYLVTLSGQSVEVAAVG